MTNALLIYLNGWPGTGKLTIAKQLLPLLNMRLILDNHKAIDLARSIVPHDANNDKAYQQVRGVILEAAVLAALESIKACVNPNGFIMTGAHAGGDQDTGVFDRVMRVAQRFQEDGGSVRVVGVIVTISETENVNRLVAENRENKLRDPETLRRFRMNELLELRTPHVLRLDVTDLSAAEAAARIADFVEQGGSCTDSDSN